MVIVLCINLTWQFFRVWLPKFLVDARGYTFKEMLNFITFYYLAAYAGSLGAGASRSWLAHRGLSLYAAQVAVFAGCCLLTSLTVLAAMLPAQPLLLAFCFSSPAAASESTRPSIP